MKTLVSRAQALTVSYRIGMALTDSLDELITSGAITPQLAMKVLQQVRPPSPVRSVPFRGLNVRPFPSV